MLQRFVREYFTLSGASFVTSNVHKLKHMFDDVNNLGPLDNYSTYPFESALQLIKNLLRTGSNIMPQIVNRLQELSQITIAGNNDQKTYPIIEKKNNKTTLHIRKDFLLRKGQRDEWFLLKNNVIVKFEDAVQSGSNFFVRGTYIGQQRNLFTKPCRSSILYIFDADAKTLSTRQVQVPVEDIRCKLVTNKCKRR